MVRIRLSRIGKRNHPVYRVVVTEHWRPVKGKSIEEVGTYDPVEGFVTLQGERIREWLANGAKPSTTVHNLLVSNGVIDDSKIRITRQKEQQSKEAA